jgi:hypothetical protein
VRIRISWRGGEATGILNDSDTAAKIAAALPVESSANTWGEEVYFSLPLKTTLARNACDVVDPGTICYWVQGGCMALPFGPTPVSKGSECRLVTAVNLVGRLDGNPRVLAGIRDGDTITVSRIDE